MQNEQLTQLQAQIEERLTAKQLSQNALAKEVGISAAHLMNVRKGNWTLVGDKTLNRLVSFFGTDSWKTRNTRNLRIVTNLCQDAQLNSRFLAVSAYTGAGKTTALKHYSRKEPRTYYMLANFFMQRKGFLSAMQRSMGIDEGGSVETMIGAVVTKLNATDKPLLIIDDAGKLNDANFRMLQVIYDETENSAGIVLGGTEYLKEYLDRSASKNKMGFRELKRRIAYWQPLFPPQASEVATICADYGIDSTDVIKYITNTCTNYGSIRNMITNAVKMSQDHEMPINVDLLESLALGDTAWRKQTILQH